MATRRGFLLGSAAVVGGLAVGFRIYNMDRPPDAIGLEPGQSGLTPYVVIDPSGITVITPRAEMGQGIHTTLAALVAEELDVAFEDIRVIHGPASEAYANNVLYGARPMWRRLRYRPTQATGGQTSIRDAYVKMRQAGAAARLMLLQAAAERTAADIETLETREGAVVDADGRAIPYVDLAEAAASIEPPQDPPLKPRAQWRILGRSLPRVDMVAKCTGTAWFDDVEVRSSADVFRPAQATRLFGFVAVGGTVRREGSDGTRVTVAVPA